MIVAHNSNFVKLASGKIPAIKSPSNLHNWIAFDLEGK